MNATALFEARGLHMRFGDRVVLENVSLAFPEGQLSGIMGPNGAGKTTCFNVLTGRYRPTRGQVLFRGQDITGLSPHRIARLGVSRSFQLLNLFNDFTAEENVLVALPGLRDHGMNMARDVMADRSLRDRAAAVLDRVGLGAKGGIPARQLPYGDRRALEIGVALAADPAVLFLDEPTSGLGADAIGRLAELVRRLKGEVTIVAIEHDMEFLFGLADTIAVIHWGQVIRHGTPDALRADPWVRNSNLGRLK
ncbi:ABC transporter ATP-binding protein [Desertibaculum subflavum]|uniref:ABC transporter ATP-binding protein n=1 Tax=Desertibaculum subflavum TaxID=2268458 RepID=UPI000E67185F